MGSPGQVVVMQDQAERPANLVRSLSQMTFLEWLGASVMLPLLPVYLKHRGASSTTVGLVIAAFFAAGVILQYPAGGLADRIGRRPVLLAGLVCFGVASLGLAIPLSPMVYLALRFVQGAGTGATQVAALALIGDTVPLGQRGRAFGSIYGSQLAGMAIGPLIGSAVGSWSIPAVFYVGGLASLAACLPVAASRRTASATVALAEERTGPATAPDRLGVSASHTARRSVAGALLTAGAFGLTIGVYESCWTLLLTSNGASSWQVGLSWTLFALPFVLMARPGGWLADHFDRRVLVFFTVLVSLACCASYPFLHHLPLLLVISAIEAVCIAVTLPAVQSLLSQAADPARLGRVQGIFATAETAMTALAAGISGSLFAVGVWIPFVACAALGAVFVAFLPWVWAPVAGKLVRGNERA